MSETVSSSPKAPGIVIFTAVLNLISVATFLFIAALSLLAIIFGNILGFADFVSQQISHYSQSPNFSYGLTFVFAVVLVTSILCLLYFLFIGVGLLKGKAIAWYLQIAMSILGLLGFPIFTILNGVILFMFFSPPVRSYFKV